MATVALAQQSGPRTPGGHPPEIDPATDDADVINVSGDHLRTRSGIATQLQAMFGGVFKGSTHRARTLEMTRDLAQ
jgi:hypothetical protein